MNRPRGVCASDSRAGCIRHVSLAFEAESGVSLQGWNGEDAERVGQALRAVLNGSDLADQVTRRLSGLRSGALDIVRSIETAIGEASSP